MPYVFIALIILLTSLIAWQDFKDRQVSLWILAVFSFTLAAEAFYSIPGGQVFSNAGYNLAFLLIQFFVLALYYFLRYRDFNKLKNSIGAADIWLLLSLTFSFSLANFIFFVSFALILSLLIYLVYKLLLKDASKFIPLAGLISAIYCASRIIMYFYSSQIQWNDDLIVSLIGTMHGNEY